MLRRDPTRIEMQLDNINEWTAAVGEKNKGNTEAPALTNAETIKDVKREMVHERIGYDPTKQSTPMSQPHQMAFR